MNETQTHEGGCLCGAIRYQVTGEQLRGTICHCSTCRKWSGAPFLAWAVLEKRQFAWVKGAPASINATPAVTRKFCGHCGTSLSFEFTDASQIIGVTIGSLDEPEKFPPSRHNWVSSKLAWLDIADDLPRNFGDAGDEKTTS